MKHYLTKFALLGVLVFGGCQPATLTPFQTSRQSSNPLGTEGQIVLSLQIDAEAQAQHPALAQLPRTSSGLADASGLSFRISSHDRALAQGQVQDNRILLNPAQLANTQPPYKLDLQLSNQQLASTLLNQVLQAGPPIPVAFRDAVVQACEGDGCVNVAGSMTNTVDHVNTGGGSVCIGICTQAPKSSGSK